MRRLPYVEPDWTAAPDWALFWAVDKDGTPYWYAVRPDLGKTVWWNVQGTERQRVAPIGQRCRVDLIGRDWRQTLRERV